MVRDLRCVVEGKTRIRWSSMGRESLMIMPDFHMGGVLDCVTQYLQFRIFGTLLLPVMFLVLKTPYLPSRYESSAA